MNGHSDYLISGPLWCKIFANTVEFSERIMILLNSVCLESIGDYKNFKQFMRKSLGDCIIFFGSEVT